MSALLVGLIVGVGSFWLLVFASAISRYNDDGFRPAAIFILASLCAWAGIASALVVAAL